MFCEASILGDMSIAEIAFRVLPVSPLATQSPRRAEQPIADQFAASLLWDAGLWKVAKSNNKSYNGWIKSDGSDLKLSGIWPCMTSNNARSAFVQSIGLTFLASAINSNNPRNPAPTIFEINLFKNHKIWCIQSTFKYHQPEELVKPHPFRSYLPSNYHSRYHYCLEIYPGHGDIGTQLPHLFYMLLHNGNSMKELMTAFQSNQVIHRFVTISFQIPEPRSERPKKLQILKRSALIQFGRIESMVMFVRFVCLTRNVKITGWIV